MSDFTMENLFSRMKRMSSGSLMSLILLSGLVACSSKNGAVSDINMGDTSSISDLQEDSSFLLGQDSSGTASDLDVTSIDQTGGPSEIDSLPVKHSRVSHSRKSYKSKSSTNNKWSHAEYVSGMKEWTVARGESLSLIAEKVFGNQNSVEKLLALNPQIEDSNVLNVGQILRLPEAEYSAQAAGLSIDVQGSARDKVDQAQVSAEKQASNSDVDTKSNSSLVVSNSPSQGASSSVTAISTEEQAGAMATVPVVAATPPAPAMDAPVDAVSPMPVAAASPSVQKVGNLSKKGNLKTALLLGSIGFLLISGFVFILGRKKA